MKIKCLSLACILLLMIVTGACANSNNKGQSSSDITESQSGENAVTTEADTTFVDNVPGDLSYDGYEFVMAFPNPADHGLDYQLSEEGGIASVIDDAVFRRNTQIEERFDITLSGITAGNSDTQAALLSKAVLSGDDAVDLAFIAFSFSGIPWITSGYAMPWNDVEYIDTSRAYWNQSMVENLSVAGNYFLLQGDINWPSMMSTQVCFFNNNVANDHNIENLYDTVKAGTWTFDKLLTTAKSVARDLNNDGNYDETDQYGVAMCFYGAVYEIGIAANYRTVLSTEDGFQVNVNTDKFKKIVDYTYDLIYNGGVTYIERYDYVTDSKGIKIFFDDRALFMLTGLGTGDYFRNEKSDYGIIPCPKYDEQQDNYYTTNDQWGLSCSIPNTTTNTARTGAITEALCALSGKLIYPKYYEVVLSERNTRDEESKEMLDLIFSNVIYDPGISFGTVEAYIPLYKLVMQKSTDLSSWDARYSKKIQKQFDDLYEFVVDNYT